MSETHAELQRALQYLFTTLFLAFTYALMQLAGITFEELFTKAWNMFSTVQAYF